MGLAGDSDGVLVISLTSRLAKQIVGSMLGMSEDEFDSDADILDGVGEIGNMVAGGAKTTLAKGGLSFKLSLPTTVAGDKIVLQPKSGTPGAIVDCKIGSELLRVGIWMQGVHD